MLSCIGKTITIDPQFNKIYLDGADLISRLMRKLLQGIGEDWLNE